MKRIVLGLVCILFLCSLGPLPANAWWWHRHKSNSKSADPSSGHKSKKAKDPGVTHSRGNSDPLYTSPKTVGWWHHKGPGPMGAGAD
jgi:hypothetical protein